MGTETDKILPSEQDISLAIEDIERRSSELIVLLKETNEKMDDFYESSDMSCGDGMISKENVDSLKRSTKRIKRSYRLSYRISDELNSRWRDSKEKEKAFFPTNTAVDSLERRSEHFAKGFGIYKLLWVCYIGSLFGVLIELAWCYLRTGAFESRSGLVYGPFNLLYGAAAMVISAALYRYRNRGYLISFIGGFTVGSLAEYLCSWGQELAFGSRSWDYSNMPLNINGRICLLYSIFWGILGIVWIKKIYPLLSKLILKIPNKAGKIVTWVLLAFFVFNSVMTVLSVARWTQRLDGIEAQNEMWSWFDAHFPNERMEKIFANMKFNK